MLKTTAEDFLIQTLNQLLLYHQITFREHGIFWY